jgi:hypothetical protein
MENANVCFYKDGNDIIIVFKNASKDIEDILKDIVSSSLGFSPSTKAVPGLEPPVISEMSKPSNFDEYERVMPDFLTDEDIGISVFDEIVENEDSDDAKHDSIQSVDVIQDDEPLDTFINGKYKGMKPEDVVAVYGNIGFYDLCGILKEGVSNEFLSKEIKETVKAYYKANRNNLGQIKELQSGELEPILLALYPICEDMIMEKIKAQSFADLPSFLSVATPYILRRMIWDSINSGLATFIKEID